MEIKTPQSSGSTRFVKRMLLFFGVLLMCMFGLAIFVPGPIQKNAYMGAEYCGSCHQEQYQSWLSSSHVRAYDNLLQEHKNNFACLSCHATGVLHTNESFLKGVQCEACHGPGQYYASLHVKKDPRLSKLLFMQEVESDQTCRHCHTDAANLWSHHPAMRKIDSWSNAKKPFHGETIKKAN